MLFPGCDMTEDNRNCPDKENVTLNFSLHDKNGAEVFKNRITATELMLFDGTGALHSSRTVATASLGSNQEIRFALAPGTYSVVAWSNAAGNTNITAAGNIFTPADGQVVFNTTESGDPLYTAPAPALGLTRSFNPTEILKTFTVPDKGAVDETIHFTHAHNKLDVYVKGYSMNGKQAVIRIEKVQRGFTFYMNYLSGGAVTYSQQSVVKTTPDGPMGNAAFNIPRVKKDNDVLIHVVNPETNAVDCTEALSDILDSITGFDLDVEITIPILFEYFEGSFTVKMPSWATEGTKPGLD